MCNKQTDFTVNFFSGTFGSKGGKAGLKGHNGTLTTSIWRFSVILTIRREAVTYVGSRKGEAGGGGGKLNHPLVCHVTMW